MTGRFPVRLPYTPISVGIHVTNRCNLSCPFCYNRFASASDTTQPDLTAERCLALLTHPNLRNAFRVAFIGGEPLLHPDLFEFIELARHEKKLSHIATNALLIERRLDELRSSSLDAVQVSLYAEQRDRQIESVQLLRRAKPHLPIVLSQIVTAQPESWAAMREAVDAATDLGIRDLMFMAYLPLSDEDVDLCFFNDNAEMQSHLDAFAAEYGSRFNLSLPAPLRRNPAEHFCVVPYTAPYVGADGSVSPCCNIVPPSDKMGNVFLDDFWNRDFLLDFRRNFDGSFPVHPRCRHCTGWAQGRSKEFFA